MTLRILLKRVRPSGHSIGVFEETFRCMNEKQHEQLLMHFLDLMALKCGLDKGEFDDTRDRLPFDLTVRTMMGEIEEQIERLWKAAEPHMQAKDRPGEHAP